MKFKFTDGSVQNQLPPDCPVCLQKRLNLKSAELKMKKVKGEAIYHCQRFNEDDPKSPLSCAKTLTLAEVISEK